MPITERRWGGWAGLAGAITAFAALSVVSIDAKAWVLQLTVALACLGSNAVWRPRPRSAMARIEDGSVGIDDETWTAGHIPAASVARGEHGFSVAVVRQPLHEDQRAELFFLEVESVEDARALLAAWGAPWPGETLVLHTRNEHARTAQRILGGIGGIALLLGALWQVFFPALQENDPTYLFGPLAVLATVLSIIVFLADKPLRKRVVLAKANAGAAPVGSDVVSRHIRAHLANRVVDEAENAEAPALTPETAVRARILDKSDETTRAWLTRIDTLAGGSGGYRSSEPTAQELWDVVDDDGAHVRSRLAAARLLARSHRVDAGALRARIADVGPRLRVVLEEDAETAAAELDALGPLFRPRTLGR